MSWINYIIVTDKTYEPNDTYNQWKNFLFTNNLKGSLYLVSTNNFSYIKSQISQKTNIPIENMIEIGDLDGGNGYYKYNFSDNNTIGENCFFIWMKKYGGLYILLNFNYTTPLENAKKLKN